MPRRLRTWRFTFWAALIPSALLALAAAANVILTFGVVFPNEGFVCWRDERISVGANSGIDRFDCFGEARSPRVRKSAPSQWGAIIVNSDRLFDLPVWLAPLPTLGICILAYTMTRIPLIPRCRKCRYDLRALSPNANGTIVCPECGRPVDDTR